VRRALSGFSHHCRHKRYVRTTLALDLDVDADADTATHGANQTAAAAAGRLPWPLLIEQFGVAAGPVGNSTSSGAAPGQRQRRRLRVPAGTVLQLTDLLALRALSSAAPSAHAAPAPAVAGTYRTLSFPCSADDFEHYYFGSPATRPSQTTPILTSAAVHTNASSPAAGSSKGSAWRLSAFAAEEAAVGHYATQLAWVHEYFPQPQVPHLALY
jgi:hypothetical protein